MSAPQTANLSGKVTETLFWLFKRPSKGAKVGISSPALTTTTITDNNGQYNFTDLPLGTYHIIAAKPPFYLPSGEKTISLTEAGKTYTLDLDISLDPWIELAVIFGSAATGKVILDWLKKRRK
jgi:hypothetical protein